MAQKGQSAGWEGDMVLLCIVRRWERRKVEDYIRRCLLRRSGAMNRVL